MIVKDLKIQVDDLKKKQNSNGRINNLKNELDYLKTNVSNQESRIQANEDGIESNSNSLGVSILVSDEIDMTTFALYLGFGNYCQYPCDIFCRAYKKLCQSGRQHHF